MIYIKAFLVGVATFILAFALVLVFTMRHSFVPTPAVPANAEVSFDLNSDWVAVWPPFLAGIAAFACAFYWTLRRVRRRAGAQR